jgi:hypothetical protein
VYIRTYMYIYVYIQNNLHLCILYTFKQYFFFFSPFSNLVRKAVVINEVRVWHEGEGLRIKGTILWRRRNTVRDVIVNVFRPRCRAPSVVDLNKDICNNTTKTNGTCGSFGGERGRERRWSRMYGGILRLNIDRLTCG